MKKILCLILSISMALSLISCTTGGSKSDNSDTSSIAVNTSADEDISYPEIFLGQYYLHEEVDGNCYVSVSYAQVKLNDGSANRYSLLQENIQTVNDEIKTEAENLFDDYKSKAASDDSVNYISNEQFYTIRDDDKVLSLVKCRDNTPGNEKFANYIGYNFDVQTGELLKIDDVVTDTNGLYSVILDQLNSYYPEITVTLDSLMSYSMEWSVSTNGLVFYFNPNDENAYFNTTQTVLVSYADNSDLFNQDYVFENDSCAFDMPLDVFFDVDNDNIVEKLSVKGSLVDDEDGNKYYDSLTISIDDANFLFDDLYYYYSDTRLMHLSNGKNVIYFTMHMDDDYCTTYIYNVTSGCEFVGEYDGCIYTPYPDEDEVYCSYVAPIVDPYNFKLETRSDILGTYGCYINCEASDDGTPIETDDFYSVISDITLTVEQDITLDEVDAKGETIGTMDLHTGDEWTIYRTDTKTFADLINSDGNIVRVSPDTGVVPHTINGMDENVVFDGVIYAG